MAKFFFFFLTLPSSNHLWLFQEATETISYNKKMENLHYGKHVRHVDDPRYVVGSMSDTSMVLATLWEACPTRRWSSPRCGKHVRRVDGPRRVVGNMYDASME